MIYARPGQTIAAWRAELSQALSEQQGHMSLYQLTIEPGTAFFDLHAKGSLVVPGEDRAADLFNVTQELTAKTGLRAYEVSNHAIPGHESHHNLLYWRYGEYLGVGPGAHSRIAAGKNRRALVAEKHPETWRQLVNAKGHGLIEDVTVAPSEQASEYLLMGLRISDGIDLDRFERLAGRPMDSNKIAGLKSMGLIRREGSRLSATQDGRRILNALISELAL
jgi:oxygen-independent coproporphyrinogen-3 oxidase